MEQNLERNLTPLRAAPVVNPPVGSEAEARSKRSVAIFESLIAQLVAERVTFAAWLAFLFDPRQATNVQTLRRQYFWSDTSSITRLLRNWTHTHQYNAGRAFVVGWAVDFVALRMRTEAQQITQAGTLRSSDKTIGPDYLKHFKISDFKSKGFEVLAHLGLLISYSFLVSGLGVCASWKRRGGTKRQRQATNAEIPEPRAGPLKALADACVGQVKELIKTGRPIGFVFDNINFMIKVAEPILGKIDSAVNGTCATVFQLSGATSEALNQEKAHTAFLNAPPLEPKDILLSEEETDLHTCLMVHSILRIIVTNGGDYFSRYMPLLEALSPTTDHLIPVHQSQTYPLPAMEIDESLVDGTIKVMETIYATLDIDTKSESFQKRVQFVSGDLKSVLNLDAAKKSCAGHDNPACSFWNITLIIGLFHMLMAAVTGFLILHFGQTNTARNNPGSLYYHNRILEQKPISMNSPIPYTLARNLIDVSLAACVIHCLTLESGCNTLNEYIKLLAGLDSQTLAQGIKQDDEQYLSQSWERLVTDATKVYEKIHKCAYCRGAPYGT
ncbi:hypothetical protein FRC07_002966 [Ceratobasidium sp. 392]|nr:hypothetical protein FRC07_002966 [Ceratobasidium sp. 392]